jgi:hypothetical protein
MKRRAALLASMGLLPLPGLALYDPKPAEGLSAVQGEWKGSLTYRDYSRPDRLVTLPTRLFVALSAPNELVFHYVFDDGPGKTVVSYEKMGFDFVAGQVSWDSGIKEKSTAVYGISFNATEVGVQSIIFERKSDAGIDRYRMEISDRFLNLAKDEIRSDGTPQFRNRFEFKRGGV